MEERRVLQAKVSSEMPVGLYVIVQPLCCIGDRNPIETQPEKRVCLFTHDVSVSKRRRLFFS